MKQVNYALFLNLIFMRNVYTNSFLSVQSLTRTVYYVVAFLYMPSHTFLSTDLIKADDIISSTLEVNCIINGICYTLVGSDVIPIS